MHPAAPVSAGWAGPTLWADNTSGSNYSDVPVRSTGVAVTGQIPLVLLAGGVGGARLAHGLQATIGSALTVIVNTADDLERHGLLVSPDHDTVMYTLAGIDNREWGWGIDGETFEAARMLERYGEESWFRLGDRDLATHIVRTARLRRGERPTAIALDLQQALGVAARILPMTD